MKIVLSILTLFLIYGCISESSLKPVVPMQIIHSNSAKVWVVESRVENNEEKAPKTRDFKTAFVFYSDGEFIEQKMVHLGSSKGNQGVFYLNISSKSQDTVFSLNYANNEYKTFHLKNCTSKELRLKEVLSTDSISDRYWVLRTLPKPFEW